MRRSLIFGVSAFLSVLYAFNCSLEHGTAHGPCTFNAVLAVALCGAMFAVERSFQKRVGLRPPHMVRFGSGPFAPSSQVDPKEVELIQPFVDQRMRLHIDGISSAEAALLGILSASVPPKADEAKDLLKRLLQARVKVRGERWSMAYTFWLAKLFGLVVSPLPLYVLSSTVPDMSKAPHLHLRELRFLMARESGQRSIT